MTQTEMQSKIESWLVNNLAEQLGEPAETLDVTVPFTQYGLDSIMALMLAGDLEEWLNIPVSPTLAWDYETIRDLSVYLSSEMVEAGETLT